MKKSKTGNVVSMPVKPENYFKSGRARKLPLYECLISEEWEKSGLAPVIVSRKHVNGNISWACYLVDTYCLGVKDSWCVFNQPEDEYKEARQKIEGKYHLIPGDYTLVHNVIYGAVDYAEEYGFKPYKDFDVSKYILEEDDDRVEIMDIEFGMDGKPTYFAGPFDDDSKINRIIRTLERTAGEGNFHFVLGEEIMDEDEEDEDEKPFFEEGEVEEIIHGKKDPNPVQAYLISKVVYEENFPNEGSTVGITGIEDLDIEDLFENEPPLQMEFFPSSDQEADEIAALMDIQDDTPLEDRVPIIDECITRFPHVYLYYPMRLLFANITDKPVPENLFKAFYKKFPGKPLAKILRANELIGRGQPEQAFDLFDREYKIQKAFPEQQGIFSECEIFSFLAVMCRYFTAINDMVSANFFAQGVVEFNTTDDICVTLALIEISDKMDEKVNEKN